MRKVGFRRFLQLNVEWHVSQAEVRFVSLIIAITLRHAGWFSVKTRFCYPAEDFGCEVIGKWLQLINALQSQRTLRHLFRLSSGRCSSRLLIELTLIYCFLPKNKCISLEMSSNIYVHNIAKKILVNVLKTNIFRSINKTLIGYSNWFILYFELKNEWS